MTCNCREATSLQGPFNARDCFAGPPTPQLELKTAELQKYRSECEAQAKELAKLRRLSRSVTALGGHCLEGVLLGSAVVRHPPTGTHHWHPALHHSPSLPPLTALRVVGLLWSDRPGTLSTLASENRRIDEELSKTKDYSKKIETKLVHGAGGQVRAWRRGA